MKYNQWLYNEQNAVEAEASSGQSHISMSWIIMACLALIFSLLNYCYSGETFSTFYSQEILEQGTPLARECPGAGWYCDNCGQFQCHGTKCVYCGYPRNK
jgi:hypothetical protein